MIENQIAFWNCMAKDKIETEDFYIFATGIDSPLVNLVLIRNQTPDNIYNAIKHAKDFFSRYSLPWSIYLIQDNSSKEIISKLEQDGFHTILKQYEIHTDIEKIKTQYQYDNINIIEVNSEEQFDEWILPIKDAFKASDLNSKIYLEMSKKAFYKNPGKFKHFIMYNKANEIISSGTLGFFGNVARLDNIATFNKHQKKGYGRALIEYCIERSKDASIKQMIFESSEEGINLYRKMGFVDIASSLMLSEAE